jgi:hypothetical protein
MLSLPVRVFGAMSSMRKHQRIWVLLWFVFLPGSLHAEPTGTGIDPSGPVRAAETQARELLEDGRARESVSLLKETIEQHPGEKVLRWLLARAYRMDGNDFWALRTLTAIAEMDPDDCGPILWMAWIHLKQGALDEARENLSATNCPSGTPSETRKALLLSMLEQHAGQPDLANRYLAVARKAEHMYEEDRVALRHLTSGLDPGYVPPVTGKLEFDMGWASNARAGSPADPAAKGTEGSSPVGQLNLWLRFVGPTGRWIRPSMEVEARSLGYTAQAGRDLSYLMIGGRPGVLIGNIAPNTFLAYHFDALLLAGGDRYENGPLWFYHAHRAELEANLSPNLSVFGGAGRRRFRETGRSRIEVDGGVGGSFSLRKQLRLLCALTTRWHGADKRAYDLKGGSALVSAELRLRKEWALRAGALAAIDWYPNSAGYFDAMMPEMNRRDILIKLSASGFSPTQWGIKAGVTYEYAERFSTTAPYDYRDHRILLKLFWSFTADPWEPKTVVSEGHVPLDHGVASSDFDERIQDLLRQDEAAQRSSSCVE